MTPFDAKIWSGPRAPEGPLMGPLGALFAMKDPWHHMSVTDDLFFQSVRHAAKRLLRQSPEFRDAAESVDFNLEAFRNLDDLPRLPWLEAELFKRRTLRCGDAMPALALSSCGTRGPVSDVVYSQAAKQRLGRVRQHLFSARNLTDDRPTNYLVFSYAPDLVERRGAGWANLFLTRFAPTRTCVYAVTSSAEGQPAFNLDATVMQLCTFAEQSHPVRLIGFPELIWRTIVAIQQRWGNLSLPEGSLLIHGGGWKGWSWTGGAGGRTAALRRVAGEVLGLAPERLREIFSFTEHGLPYLSDVAGRLRIPVQARVLVRDLETSAVLPPGDVGSLQFISPLNALQPTLSLRSGDRGRVCLDERGRPTILEIHGRLDPRQVSCADLAAEVVDIGPIPGAKEGTAR